MGWIFGLFWILDHIFRVTDGGDLTFLMGIALVTHQLTKAWTEHGIDSLLNLLPNPISPSSEKQKQSIIAVTNSHTHAAKRNTTIKRIRYTIIEINSHKEHLHVTTIK